jgi:hypothetical protein
MRTTYPTSSLLAFAGAAVLVASACDVGRHAPTSSSTTSGSTGSGSSLPVDAGSDVGAGGGETTLPPDACPTLPAPADCGEFASSCGDAVPLAGGGQVFLQGSAVTADAVWFIVNASEGCSGVLYRVPKAGGDAHPVRATSRLVGFEADDDVVYVVEATDDPYTVKVSALSGQAAALIGEIHGDPAQDYPYTTTGLALTRTRAGVVTYDPLGPTLPSFSLLTPTGVTLLASKVAGASLGSAPAYDGQTLFFSWAGTSLSPDSAALDRLLVGLSSGTWATLGHDAEARQLPTVAVDADSVYFATGDPSRVASDPSSGLQGISRVAKSGGPVTVLLPPGNFTPDQVVVDDSDVYFSQYEGESESIFAVPKSGGPLRHVWEGSLAWPLHVDAQNLYLSLGAPQGDVPQPGRDFIVRVPKDTSIP